MMPPSERPPRPTGRLWAIALGLVLAGVAAAGLWARKKPALEAEARRPVTLVVSGDTAGWIVPCGCTSNQSGGLLRRGAFVENLRAHGDVVVADAGGAPAGTSAYHRLKFEAILRGELAMGLDAHNLGGPEAALGATYLRDVAGRLGVPFVSANLRDGQGNLLAEPLRIVERRGWRVGLAGVLSRRYARDGLQVDDPREAVLRSIAAVKERYDALVVLAYLPEEELKQFAEGLPEASLVVGGPTGQSMVPRALGHVLIGSATNKGKFLVTVERAAHDPTSFSAGNVVEMDGKFAEEARQQENLRIYLDELARRDFAANETGFAPDLPANLPPAYRLAGSQACVTCHQGDCKLWEGSGHARAWGTLTGHGGYQVDPYCQQCHSTGYGLPGGFTSAARSPERVAVGCESCHGPSLAHTQKPRDRTPYAARDQCVRCHDRENSPQFAYTSYWPRVRHGAKD